jgi:hypothetical protein
VRARTIARPLSALAVAAGASLLSGCGGGFDLGRLDTDRSIVTSSVGIQTVQQPDSRVSDEAAIGAAVSAWPPDAAPPDTVPWVNANTGSSGAIARVSDAREGTRRCRTFTASRDSFVGSTRYVGKACIGEGGSWIVTDLNQG